LALSPTNFNDPLTWNLSKDHTDFVTE